MGCGKSKLDVASDATTITKTKSKSTKNIDHQGSKKVAKDATTVPDKVDNGNKVEAALAPQQMEGGSEKIESATEKPKEESPAAAVAGDVAAENGGAEAAHDVDKKDDSNSPKIKGEPLGVTRIVGIDAVVEAEKPKDVVEEKAPVEEAKTEAVSEAPVAVEEKEPEVAVLAVEAEASTPTPSPEPAQEKKEIETEAEAEPVKAAEEEKETEAVALPVEPEAPAEPAQDKEETEVAAATPVEPEASAPTTTEEENIPADEEVAAPAAASPVAEDTKTN